MEKAAKVKAKLLDAVNEKEKLRARLEPYSARLLELSQEKPSAASDFARQELLQIGQKYAETVGHKNSRQNLQQAQRYVCGNAELKEVRLLYFRCSIVRIHVTSFPGKSVIVTGNQRHEARSSGNSRDLKRTQ